MLLGLKKAHLASASTADIPEKSNTKSTPQCLKASLDWDIGLLGVLVQPVQVPFLSNNKFEKWVSVNFPKAYFIQLLSLYRMISNLKLLVNLTNSDIL